MLDLLCVAHYAIRNVAIGRIPLLELIQDGLTNARLFERPALVAAGVLAAAFYLSLIVSGVLLLRESRAGAVLAFAQEPFRLGLFVPSVFFAMLLLQPIPETARVWSTEARPLAGIALLVLIELTKVVTLVLWLRIEHHRTPVDG